MSLPIPITLVGENLGQRHRNLNNVVSEAYKLGERIEIVLGMPEKSAIDRLFKIDLASKHKHVEYILKNMKDADMLYVSRALKAKWLLEEQYSDVINPMRLERYIYPEMVLPAVIKMRHWIHLNLRDEIRCQEFYHYYRENDRKLAMKYLLKCPTDLIVQDLGLYFKHDPEYFYSISQYYITPHYFKMFCERTPFVAKLVYDLIEKDKSFRLSYIHQQYEYFESIKCVLKTNPDLFLDIAERHFNVNQFRKFSKVTTKFIITHKKERFLKKPELYTAWLLDVNELAKCLNSKECEELVIQLARARFLDPWFDYKNVEPLIRKIDKDKRVEFKKRVFVRKEVGEDVKDWPYLPPISAAKDDVFLSDDSVTDKNDDLYNEKYHCVAILSKCDVRKVNTRFNSLFDEYRFKSFTEALFELSKKILAESTPQNRMHMMMVLISKSGGKEVYLEALFKFLMRHRNEPPQIRAAVVRSLVKRASIWRASNDVWENLLKFGKGLGLDGGTAEAECKEGIHAVVIRSLIKTDQVTPEIITAFLKVFSPLTTDYTLTKAEKLHILQILPNLLLDSINAKGNGERAADIMENLLDILEPTEMQDNTYDNVIIAVQKLLERDQAGGKRILMRLFCSHKGRKDLMKENFDMIQTDDSYVNALKHNLSVLSLDKFVRLISSDGVALNKFLQKTSVYFPEDGGLASRLLVGLKMAKINKNLARPIAYLTGIKLKTYIMEMDVKREHYKNDKEFKKFCAEIRANAHLARPRLKSFRWPQAGVKLMANKVLVCSNVDVDMYIEQSLSWKRSARLATVLAKRSDQNVEVLKSVATMRPTIAIKVALEYFKRDQSPFRIWKTIKPLIMAVEPEDKNIYLIQKLENFNQVPEAIRPEFIRILFPLYSEQKYKKMQFNQKLLFNRVLQQIHKLLPKMDHSFVDDLLLKFFDSEFNSNIIKESQYSVHNKVEIYSDADMYVRILAKYLLLCKNENEQKDRFTRFGDMFFNCLDIYWQKSPDKTTYLHYLNIFLQALKSNSIYFSNEYVCSLKVLQLIAKNMHSQLPVEKYFKLYVEAHLSVLYYKAIKQCMNKKPRMFAGEAKDQKKNKVGMMFVAETFGRFIARDAKDLTLKYYDSIPEMYSNGLKEYFYRFRESRHSLSLPLVKGIVEGSKGFEGRVAVDMYNEYWQYGKDWDIIRELMKQKFDKNMMFFFYNEVISNPTTLIEW